MAEGNDLAKRKHIMITGGACLATLLLGGVIMGFVTARKEPVRKMFAKKSDTDKKTNTDKKTDSSSTT